MSTEQTETKSAELEQNAPTSSPKEPAAVPATGSDAASDTRDAAPAAAAAPTEAIVETAAEADGAAESAGEADGEADGEEEGAPAEGEASASPDGEKKKRKRRRRKKKKGDGVQAGAEGAEAAEGAEGAEGAAAPARKPREKKESRERPAFNLGDVVFGKVIAVLEDALIIDMSGKGNAVFDLRELLIPDDEDHGPPDEDEQAEAAEAASAVPTDVTPSIDASTAAEAPEGGADVAATEAVADAAAVEPPAKVDFAEKAAEKAADPQPTLPRVILEPGAPFVGVVHNDGGRGGLMVLTHHPKRVRKAKPIVAAAFRDKTMVWALVTGVIKGGVEVDIEGLRGFAPGSHMDMRPGADLSPFVGKRLGFSVTQYGKRGRDVVLSRRALIEAEAKIAREEALSKVQIGAVAEGVVRSVVPFGAFIDIGGVEGLVPLAEMSHNRSDGPRDVFTVGETIQVKVMRVDERGKLWLSLKATLEDPWGEVARTYALGTKHMGKIARLQPFGAFVELAPGVDGLIHAADLSFKRFEQIEEVAKVGDELEVVVASIDSSKKKIGLHPALTGDAANEAPQKVAVHKSVKVRVISADHAGVVVRVLGATGRAARGFIPPGGTGTPRGTELRKLFPAGKELEVRVIDIDPRRGEPKLSIRAHNEESEKAAYNAYRAQVKREAKFGTFGDLLQKTLKKD